MGTLHREDRPLGWGHPSWGWMWGDPGGGDGRWFGDTGPGPGWGQGVGAGTSSALTVRRLHLDGPVHLGGWGRTQWGGDGDTDPHPDTPLEGPKCPAPPTPLKSHRGDAGSAAPPPPPPIPVDAQIHPPTPPSRCSRHHGNPGPASCYPATAAAAMAGWGPGGPRGCANEPPAPPPLIRGG